MSSGLAQDNICAEPSYTYDMKKQELIHVHGLIAEIRNRYEVQNNRPIDLSEYEKIGVKPTSIHHSKTAHKDAIFALIDGLTDTMKAEEELLTLHVDR